MSIYKLATDRGSDYEVEKVTLNELEKLSNSGLVTDFYQDDVSWIYVTDVDVYGIVVPSPFANGLEADICIDAVLRAASKVLKKDISIEVNDKLRANMQMKVKKLLQKHK